MSLGILMQPVRYTDDDAHGFMPAYRLRLPQPLLETHQSSPTHLLKQSVLQIDQMPDSSDS